MYYRLQDTNKELNELHDKGLQKGYSVGWDWNLFPMTIKMGTTSYFAAPPHTGKTEFWFDILINLSCLHNLNHLIYSPETGTAAEIFAELVSKFVGKSYFGENKMTQAEKTYGEMFIQEHFIIIDPVNEDLTIVQFYEMVDNVEKELAIKIHTTTIDPWNELKEEFLPEDLGREDKYLSRILGYCRKNATANNRHNTIITHVRDQALVVEDGIRYTPIPTARELAGGQVWFRKGLLMGILWRPPFGLVGHDGTPYKQNQTVFKIAKSKPKGVSKNGLYNFFFDIEKQRYYMEGHGGVRIYADRGSYDKPQQPTTKEINKAVESNIEVSKEKKEREYTQIKTVKHWQETEKDDLFDFKESWE